MASAAGCSAVRWQEQRRLVHFEVGQRGGRGLVSGAFDQLVCAAGDRVAVLVVQSQVGTGAVAALVNTRLALHVQPSPERSSDQRQDEPEHELEEGQCPVQAVLDLERADKSPRSRCFGWVM